MKISRIKLYIEDDNSWISKTKRKDDGNFSIKIGTAKVPESIATLWDWGTKNQQEEQVVKIAHEHAHVLLDPYDHALIDFLNGSNNVDERFNPFLLMFVAMRGKRVHGLSKMDFYTNQSDDSNYDVPTHVDMTETVAAYIVSPKYFEYRMRSVEQTKRNQIRSYVEQILRNERLIS